MKAYLPKIIAVLALTLGAATAPVFASPLSDYHLLTAVDVNIESDLAAEARILNIATNNKLWNFYEATTVDVVSSNSSRLAPYADVEMQYNFDGSMLAKSHTGSAQADNFLSNWIPRMVKVPEPSSLLLILIALGFIGLVRLRHR